jgi:hypothetical protein
VYQNDIGGEKAMRMLDRASSDRRQADLIWRSAIREAISCSIPIEQISAAAKATIEDVLAVADQLNQSMLHEVA